MTNRDTARKKNAADSAVTMLAVIIDSSAR